MGSPDFEFTAEAFHGCRLIRVLFPDAITKRTVSVAVAEYLALWETELPIVALNDIGYRGPLSVEWEDIRMDRVHGATEAAAFVRKLDFPPSALAFDAAFDKKNQ